MILHKFAPPLIHLKGHWCFLRRMKYHTIPYYFTQHFCPIMDETFRPAPGAGWLSVLCEVDRVTFTQGRCYGLAWWRCTHWIRSRFWSHLVGIPVVTRALQLIGMFEKWLNRTVNLFERENQGRTSLCLTWLSAIFDPNLDIRMVADPLWPRLKGSLMAAWCLPLGSLDFVSNGERSRQGWKWDHGIGLLLP